MKSVLASTPAARAATSASRSKLILAFAAVYTIWGSTYLAIRYAIETVPPFLMAGGRFLLAGAILFLWARRRGAPNPSRREWRSATVVGALLFLCGNGSLTWAEQRVPTGLAALLLSVIPLWMVLLHLVEERGAGFGPRLGFGLALGILGIIVLVGPSDVLGGGRVDTLGAAALLGGAFCWAAGSLHSRRVALPPSASMAAALEMLSGGFLLVVAGVASGEAGHFHPQRAALRSLLAIAYLVIFGSLVGFTSYNYMLAHSTPARVGTYAYVNPVIAVFLGWWVAHEPVTPRTLAAAVIIISAVVLILSHPPTALPATCEEAAALPGDEPLSRPPTPLAAGLQRKS
jgi:drug/metabolite transporter (DMT)-like permease